MSHRILSAVLLTQLVCSIAQAQWQEPGGGVAYTPDKVGIGPGVTAPSQALEINGNVRVLPANGSFSVGGTAPAGFQFFATNSAAQVSTGFQLHSFFNDHATSFIANLGKFGTYIAHNREPQQGGFTDTAIANQAQAVQLVLGDSTAGRMRMFSVTNFPAGVETPRIIMNFDGNVGIGTEPTTERLTVAGNITVTGNINAKWQDVAEWVPSRNDLSPGTVVVLDPEIGNGVMASGAAYDTTVAGVVSAQPGIILGEAGDAKEQIATTGRVRVRVDATSAPIRVGDLLVTSGKSGMAMRSEAVEIRGRQFHQPGTIIGKALQALESGEGEILVLLSLQ